MLVVPWSIEPMKNCFSFFSSRWFPCALLVARLVSSLGTGCGCALAAELFSSGMVRCSAARNGAVWNNFLSNIVRFSGAWLKSARRGVVPSSLRSCDDVGLKKRIKTSAHKFC